MAFLLPESIPSRSDLPARLRMVARSLRDFAPDEVTVWLRKSAEGESFLVVLEPRAGIAVIDVPLLSMRRRSKSSRIFESIDKVSIASAVVNAADEFEGRIDARAISKLPVRCVIAVPTRDDLPRERLTEGDRELPILTRSDLSGENLMAALQRVFDGERHDPLSDQEENIARAIVNPEIILRRHSSEQLPLLKEPAVAPQDVFVCMDREQERLAEHLHSGYRVIKGVAGSGKTVILLNRARFLHRHYPNWRILVLCFNRVLAGSLAAELSPNRRITVTNVDRLTYRLAGGVFRGRSRDFEELVVAATNIAVSLPDSERFDAVLVDEAQDFSFSRLDFAYAMLKSERLLPEGVRQNRDNFVMAYDRPQDVYRSGGARWNPPGLDPGGGPRTQRGRVEPRRTNKSTGQREVGLRKNYRNTLEIIEFALSVLDKSNDWRAAAVDLEDPDAIIPPEAAMRSGPMPSVIMCADERGEAERIAGRVEGLMRRDIPPEDIAVMHGGRGVKSHIESHIVESLRRRSVPYLLVGEDRDGAATARGRVRVSTLTKMKGLEFNRVFVGGVNQMHVPDVAKEDQFKAAMSWLYVAMTRAVDELEITISGDGPIGEALLEAERFGA